MTHKPSLFEFHVSRQARDRYLFDQAIFAFNGNAIFANFHAARVFAQKMNEKRDLLNFPEQAIKAGQIVAMGLIDEILHLLIEQYRRQFNPEVMEKALAWLAERIGAEALETALLRFCDEFPPVAVYRGELNLAEYLAGETEGRSHRQIALEELLMLWLANANPAFNPYRELFDDAALEKHTAYPKIIDGLVAFFQTQPRFGRQNQTLIEVLRAPALAAPHSLSGQLEFIRQRWGTMLGKYLYQLLSGLDLIKEEEKPVFFGPGPAFVPEYKGWQMLEIERFSPDSAWMPRLVLIAKNTYVWLDQLSKEYRLEIRRLDQVPDSELDRLAQWGFSGLWLIGLWERSSASQRIKQMCGNPDAVPSAYSLYDYVIANDLGGEEAYQNLRSRAWQRGLRLAADMVPNHVGIYSKWVLEHPDWFISLPYSPFPGYTFNGANLSEDGRVGIYIEDHYYSRSDAAVVFKRVDHWSGDTRFIYHGNDGTSMPWNDTAQLNYLDPNVREAAIQTILHVARKFPVIRFDAAMTLSKKHFQRLWFPEPGSGGDIPTRAEFGLSRAQFDAAMPEEFWREVVDRVAAEVPDTLLLAEAFWMMEGYFVRTLGMHRVYNSAFMNMLRDEKNAEYRQLIKNTLEFDPQILKRYVNFMNNPDEETAIAQFGRDDKYFGICALMATLPGLPMFGHGQVEGFHEKYGMEYRRAYWEEFPDNHLVQRHEREIFPLLHRRHMFAEVENFFLYDLYTPEGRVDENVFAYSNLFNGERSLVLFHNKWSEASGWIKTSAAYIDKGRPGEGLKQKNLAEALGLQNEANTFTIFRDHISGLEYIRNNRELHEKGLYVQLSAYKYNVFVDFRTVTDSGWGQYRQLAETLNGRGVPSMEEALTEMFLQPILYPFRSWVNAEMYQWLFENRVENGNAAALPPVLSEASQKMLRLLDEIKARADCDGEAAVIARQISLELEAALKLPVFERLFPLPASRNYHAALRVVAASRQDAIFWGVLFSWLVTHKLGEILCEEEAIQRSRSLIDEWLLGKIVAQVLAEFAQSDEPAWEAVTLLKILISHQAWDREPSPRQARPQKLLQSLLKDSDVQRYLRINRYQGVLWFHKESFDAMMRGLLAIAAITCAADPQAPPEKVAAAIADRYAVIKKLLDASEASGYQVEKLFV